MKKVLIIGGNGFIGSHIVQCFRQNGVEIIAPPSKVLNVLDKNELVKQFEGVDTVIHNGAKASDWGREEDFYKINVQGTENGMYACLKCGVAQVILTGSCSVYGEEHHPHPKDESSPYNSHYKYFADKIFPSAMNFYRDSKRDSVVFAKAFAKKHGIKLTVLHPVWVYGEGELNTGFLQYLQTVKSKIPAIMGSRKNCYHVIYAGNLAQGYFLAWQKRKAGVHEYILSDTQPVCMEEFYKDFCTAAGLKKPPNIPKKLLYPPVFLLEFFAAVFKAKKPPVLTRGRLNMFYDSIAYSAQKAQTELGFCCKYPQKEAMARTVKWYKENGYL